MDAREMVRFLIEEPTVFDYVVLYLAGFVSGILVSWIIYTHFQRKQ